MSSKRAPHRFSFQNVDRDDVDAHLGGDGDGVQKRRPQNNLRPPTDSHGDPAIRDVLVGAFEDAAAEDHGQSPYPHGFHSWPAGLHPAIARELLGGLLPLVPKGLVLDPFAGGGTVGVEAVLHRTPFIGADINPLSRLVGGERTLPRRPEDAAAVAALADEVCERSKDRVRERRPSRVDIPVEVARHYLPHTLMELSGLLHEIDATARGGDELSRRRRRSLAVCFSAILTKVSQRRGDTDHDREQREIPGATPRPPPPPRPRDGGKRVGRFIPSEQFAKKVHELVDRQLALFEAVGDDVDVDFIESDARDLPRALSGAGKTRRASLIVTSPPYGGTYDYALQHADRLAFLGLDTERFLKREVFARRDGRREDFDRGTLDLLKSMRAVVDDDGLIVFIIGDASFGGRLIDAADHLSDHAAAADLEIVASAHAPRPEFHKPNLDERSSSPPRPPWSLAQTRERFEHIVALRPLSSSATRVSPAKTATKPPASTKR